MHERIRRNLEEVRSRIADACGRSGRAPEEVLLVAVTKSVDAATTRSVCELGVRDLGENRVGPGLEKVRGLADLAPNWHFIGHLQRNKAKRALEGFFRFHGVESLQLANLLQREAATLGAPVDVWIEVNVAGEANKYGISPGETEGFVQAVAGLDHLRLRGLMTMAPWSDDPEDARPVFRTLRELRDRTAEAAGVEIPGLSMGMSGDYEVAIEEGATIVRVGSALFA